jgi:hypothetical protein
MAAAACRQCDTNDEPPIICESTYVGCRSRWPASDSMCIAEKPAVKKPSTSCTWSPASSSAPRALSAWSWNAVLSGAKRVGCSNAPTTAVRPQMLIARGSPRTRGGAG